MKKLVVLVGFAAAIYGVKKLISGKEEQASQPYGASGYASQPQG